MSLFIIGCWFMSFAFYKGFGNDLYDYIDRQIFKLDNDELSIINFFEHFIKILSIAVILFFVVVGAFTNLILMSVLNLINQ